MKKTQIFYEIERVIRHDPNGESTTLYHTRIHKEGKVDKREFLRACRRNFGLKRDDVLEVLEAVSKTIMTLALEGYSVDVPHLGHFQLDIKSKDVATLEETGEDAVKYVKMRFRSSSEMREQYTHYNITLTEYPR